MKKFLTAAVISLLAGSAFAQTAGDNHMISFGADSSLLGSLNLNSSKTRGQKKDNDTALGLDLNYAYTLPMIRNIQLGARLLYDKGTQAGRGDYEDYGAQVGGIWNWQWPGQALDLTNAIYTSLYVGYEWDKTYTSGAGNDEVFLSTLALGKRMSLENWGIKHLVYSPEVALQSRNSKTGGSLEYVQNLQFRFLQFSVLF